MRVQTVRPVQRGPGAARHVKASTRRAGTASGPLVPSYDVPVRGDAAARAAYVAMLQRAVGNRQVAQLLHGLAAMQGRGPTRAPGSAVGHGGIEGLHGRTEGTFEGGRRPSPT